MDRGGKEERRGREGGERVRERTGTAEERKSIRSREWERGGEGNTEDMTLEDYHIIFSKML